MCNRRRPGVPGVFIESTDESELGAESPKHVPLFSEARNCLVQDKNLQRETVHLQACTRAMNMLERILAALDRSTVGARALQLAVACCPHCVSAEIAASIACPAHTGHADLQALGFDHFWQLYCKYEVSI